MPSIAKPVITHPSLQRNQLGLTIRDYEGTMSTLWIPVFTSLPTAASSSEAPAARTSLPPPVTAGRRRVRPTTFSRSLPASF